MRARLLVVMALVIAGLPSVADAKPRWQELPLPPVMPAASQSGRVDVAGAKLYYAIYGKGEPVILLHGGLGNADHFALQIPALAAKFQVIAIDSRGQGRSSLSKAKLSYQRMADDVIAVMDKLEVAKASIVGWSDGGEIGLYLAIHYPARVAKLFIVGANYDANGSKPRNGPTSATFAAYSAKCRKDYERLSTTPRSYGNLIDAMLPLWRSPMGFTKQQLQSITAPTMVADGDHDEIIVLDQIKEMATLIPNAKLTVFPETSHFVMWQDPASFNKAVVEFLE